MIMNFKSKPSLLALFVVFSSFIYSQSNCPNSDFSIGDFSNWQGYYGGFYEPDTYQGFQVDRHQIITEGYYDTYTCSTLFSIPPGESFSAKLGNENVGAQAEQLRYSLTVTPETNLFIYKYAVVLEDPGHIPSHQPSFTIEVTDEAGEIIDPVCGYYYVYAQQGMPGWNKCIDVVWKDWTVVGLNLDPYMGENITIVFTTRDCEQTGHFGYCYLSAKCSSLNLQVSYCPQNMSASITAPAGFEYLWDNGQTTQTIEIEEPVSGSEYSCQLTAVNGCQVTISATIYPTIVDADFTFNYGCAESPITFTDMSTLNQNEIVNWKWNFGDGTAIVTGEANPDHAFPDHGSFDVQLIAYSTEGCTDTIVKQITVYPKPNANFSFTQGCQYLHIPFFNNSSIQQATIIDYTWDFGDGTSPLSGNPNPTHYFPTDGIYSVELVTTSSDACTDTIIKDVEVFEVPEIVFYYDYSPFMKDTLVLCPLDSMVYLGVVDCGINYTWTRKSDPDWNSFNQIQLLSNPGLGFYLDSYYIHVVNQFGCFSVDTIHVLWDFAGCVGVTETNQAIKSVFPNPSNGKIVLELKPGIDLKQVSVYNINGLEVFSARFSNQSPQQITYDFSDYDQGIYYLVVKTTECTESMKILIE